MGCRVRFFKVCKEMTVLIIWNNNDYKNKFKGFCIHVLGIPEIFDIITVSHLSSFIGHLICKL